MDILESIADYAKYRVEQYKRKIPLSQIKSLALACDKGGFSFETALKKKGLSLICECKKASPSKGVIDEEYNYMDIAKQYEEAGADCISVLTEPKWFSGDDKYLENISKTVLLPCLRKDFTVDEYMIYQAKALGASAILLIVSLLDKESLSEYMSVAEGLGLSALVEVHDEREVETALECNARIIGVNNRNLKDFTVDRQNSRRLRKIVPDDVLFVSESGIKDSSDIKYAIESGADAVLIGETLMRAKDKKSLLTEFKRIV
ncbi:MAG: indole-3-glycerol phosphate synthase TrpC [Christensenellaceae bacterium]